MHSEGAQRTEFREIYETHTMSSLAVIYHEKHLENREVCFQNWHENVELLYFKSGEADVYRNGERIHARPGDILIFPTNCLHGITAKRVSYDCLILDRGACLSVGVDTSTLTFPAVVRDRRLALYFKETADAFALREEEYRVCAVRGAIYTLLAYLCRNYGEVSPESDSRAVEGIRRTLRYVRDHLDEPLSIDHLSSVAGFSKFHFSREFKRVTSYTVVTYVNLLRIERAKALLSEGTLSVGEIASVTGFRNLSYFSKTFKEQTGISPSEYLAERRKK